MNINKKIIQFIDSKGISQRQFTLQCNMSEGVLRRGNNIGSGYLKIIKTNYPELNMNWLLFDEGEMLLDGQNLMNETSNGNKKECEYCKYLEKELKNTEKILEAKEETIQILKHQLGIVDKGNSKAC